MRKTCAEEYRRRTAPLGHRTLLIGRDLSNIAAPTSQPGRSARRHSDAPEHKHDPAATTPLLTTIFVAKFDATRNHFAQRARADHEVVCVQPTRSVDKSKVFKATPQKRKATSRITLIAQGTTRGRRKNVWCSLGFVFHYNFMAMIRICRRYYRDT